MEVKIMLIFLISVLFFMSIYVFKKNLMELFSYLFVEEKVRIEGEFVDLKEEDRTRTIPRSTNLSWDILYSGVYDPYVHKYREYYVILKNEVFVKISPKLFMALKNLKNKEKILHLPCHKKKWEDVWIWSYV